VKRAIVSDIHGNLEALEAVLADISHAGVDSIYCLGDIVGYGPNPRECIDRVISFDQSILGNHDQGALYDPEGFSSGAERAIFWTRDQLEMDDGNPEQMARRWQFLSELPRTVREGQFTFVHGSVRNPINEYVFPEDIYNRRKMEKLFSMVQRVCFQGHTHVPGVFTAELQFHRPGDMDHRYEFCDDKVMINVGSVGQPRDGDWRSCYVILDEQSVTFRRVEYNVQDTVDKIYAIAELERFLGDRLLEVK